MNPRSILGAICVLASAIGTAGASETLLLRNVRIFVPDQAVMTEPMQILLSDGAVEGVGVVMSVKDAESIDCQGAYALPGLFDSHTHLSHLTHASGDSLTQMLRGFVEEGVLQVRDVGGPVDVMRTLRGRIESGELLGPDIFYAGPMLEEGPLTWAEINAKLPGFTVEVNDSATVDSLIPALAAGGATLVKTFGKFDRGVYAHLVDVATAHHLPIAHDPGPPLFHEIPMDFAIECGARSIEHGKAPWPAVLIDSLAAQNDSLLASDAPQMNKMMFLSGVFERGEAAISSEKLDRIIASMISHDVYLCPTLQVFPMIRAMGGPPDEPPMQKMMREKSLAALDSMSRFFTQRMMQGGVKMLVGQDGCFPSGTFAEITELQKAGMPASEILRGLTIYPARFLRIENRYGSIEPGKVANIVVVANDPLADIANLGSPTLVVKGGKVVWRAAQ